MTDDRVQKVLNGIARLYAKEIYFAGLLEYAGTHMTKVTIEGGELKITSVPREDYQYPPQPKP